MGLIQDITSLMRKGPELASQVNSVKLNTKSIARGAKDSTFQFPCLVVDSTPIDMANTVARTLDQVYATFTQTWLSMNSMFDVTIDPTPLSYLRKLHQNIKLESSMIDELSVDDDNIDEYMENVYNGNYRLYMNPEQTYGVLFNVSDITTKELMESHKDLLQEYMSEFDLAPLEIMEADSPNAYDLAQAVVQGQIEKGQRARRETEVNQSTKLQAPKLLDRDIKRSNDLLPFGIQVRLIAVNDKKEFVQFIDFIVGVKTILHPVSSNDMIENIARALQNKSLAFKLMKWTTGEISLVKDIILNLKDIKMDAMSRNNTKKSPFFNTLKRLKNKRVGMSNLTVPHALIPNATIVITSYEADYLENNYAIDVRNEAVASKLIKNLFLMSFIILDEGTGTMSVMYDADRSFQTYSLETLERDNQMNSNKLGREIGRMISR